MTVSRLLLTATLLILTRGGLAFLESSCQEGASLHIDIFEEIISNFTDVSQQLTPAPTFRGVDPTTPAYEFRGRGSGIHLSSQQLSNSIRRASCANNEFTFYTNIFFKDSNSDGPVFELWYPGHDAGSLPVIAVYMNAGADEITIMYRHRGVPHPETFTTRLHGGKWRSYALSLSGNQLSLYVDCELAGRRRVPLPDYCANDSDVAITIADSNYIYHEDFGTGIYGFLQRIGFQFGEGGIRRQCPNIPESCPSCGRFLNLVEKVYELQEEVEVLKQRVAYLENNGLIPPNNPNDSSSPPTDSNDCIRTVNGEQQTFPHSTFANSDDGVGYICYCSNGNKMCEPLNEVCSSTPTGAPVICSNTSSSTVNDPDPTSIVDPNVQTCSLPFNNEVITTEEVAVEPLDGECRVFSCQEVGFDLFVALPTNYPCTTNYSACTLGFTYIQREVAKCCGSCSVCDFANCSANSECRESTDSSAPYTCKCLVGFQRSMGDECVDIDECSLGPQQNGHNCPTNSTCRNTVGSFECECHPGFDMTEVSNGGRRCKDVDECLSPDLNNCTANSQCINEVGGFRCECLPDYQLVDGQCIPVCDPPCQNGGTCVSPSTCSCLQGYRGSTCEENINECASPTTNSCNHPKSECVDTVGGYFCKCESGFQGNGSDCQDVDECRTNIHNCLGSARCQNTIGGFKCLCGRSDCTGWCQRKGKNIRNRQSMIDNCRNCTCIDGELTCLRLTCDCDSEDRMLRTRPCCSECERRDCRVRPEGHSSPVLIRPSSTWFNPENRCERYDCDKNLRLTFTNLTDECPVLNCPETVVPMGKCCPVCTLPTCNQENLNRVASVRNGCRTCTCKSNLESSEFLWDCHDKIECPAISCDPREILFFKDGCCPVCARTALNAEPRICTV